jgi:glutathione S-transferase
MLTVHHLENSRSQRILWLLEELGVPYEVRRYERNPKTRLAPPELMAVHPLGKSPVITDGETTVAQTTVAETGAIVDYILDRFGEGRLIPAAGTPERLRYTYWLHFAEGSAMPPLVMTLIFGETARRTPALIRPVAKLIGKAVRDGYLAPTIAAQLDFMEAELAKGGFFAGEAFSAADVMMSFPVEAASGRVGLQGKTLLQDWLGRMHGRSAYQAALLRGGPYAYA